MLNTFSKQTTLPNLTQKEEFPCPEKIGPYQIKTLFKKGGMSFLYLTFGTSKPIIVKILPPKLMQSEELKERFLKEAKIISISNHPNIVKYYSHGEWEGGLYIAMEYIEGISLRQFIQSKSFHVKKALEIILQIAYAICHLHDHGIIHGDIKPENILITEYGEIKVIDFGIAKFFNEPLKDRKTLVGTPFYMSRELKENPDLISTQIDIYALGMITYELLVGKLSNGMITLSSLPKNLKNIVAKALKLNPKNAYSDIVEFITDISENIKLKSASEKEEEEVSDLVSSYDTLEEILLPPRMPKIPKLELSLAKKKVNAFFGSYFDSFKIKEDQYLLCLAESLIPGAASSNYSLIFRGMVKNVIRNFSFAKNLSLPSFLDSLNQALVNDPVKQSFCFTALLYDSSKNELSFASCGHDLFHLNKNKILEVYNAQNPLIGSNSKIAFFEKTIPFSASDIFLVPSLEIGQLIKSEKQSLLKKNFFVNMETKSKFLAKNILFELKIKTLKRSALLLTLEKTI